MELLWIVCNHDYPFHVIVTPCIFPLKKKMAMSSYMSYGYGYCADV